MSVLIVFNQYNSEAKAASDLVVDYLRSQNRECVIFESNELAQQFASPSLPYELAFVLGGDGTILRCARYVAHAGVPIMGINYGTLGFLANSNEENVLKLVKAALEKEEVVEERRTNLCARVIERGVNEADLQSDCLAGGKTASGHLLDYFALNEFVITGGIPGLLLELDVRINGQLITTLRGDGVIVSSATGSSAYSLSAGGPLVGPEFEGLIITPLASHTLQARTMITNPQDVVEIAFSQMSEQRYKERAISLVSDGVSSLYEEPPEKILITKGANPTRMLWYGGANYYRRLSEVFFS